MSNPTGNILRLTANESLTEGNINATIIGIEGLLVEGENLKWELQFNIDEGKVTKTLKGKIENLELGVQY